MIQIVSASAVAAAVMPAKNQNASGKADGWAEPSATATEMVPGPVVIGMVSGNNAMSSSISGGDPRSRLSGLFRRLQALMATTSPPATRSAAKVMPKNARTNDPAQSANTMTTSAYVPTRRASIARSPASRWAVSSRKMNAPLSGLTIENSAG